jgi:uncharacterized protein (UPF0333 family)
MQRGQISLDFLISILIIIISIGAISVIALNFRETREEIFLENKLKNTAHEISLTIISSQSMNDTNFYSKTIIKNLTYKNTSFFPTITITDNNIITVKEKISGKNIESTEYFYKNENTQISIEDQFLVIKNV